MKKDLKDSFRAAMPLFIGLSLSIVFFFLILRYDGLNSGFSKIISILKPFVYGGVIAYLLKTPCNWIEGKLEKFLPTKRQGLAKGLSVISVLLISFLVIYLLMVMIIPALVESLVAIAQGIPGVLTQAEKTVSKYAQDNPVVVRYVDQLLHTIKIKGPDWIRNTILPNLSGAVGGVAGAFGSILMVFYNLFIGLIVCIYILLSKETFARQGKMIVYAIFKKDFAEKVLKEFAFIDKTFVGFFAGKILDSVVVGIICYIFCLILQFTMGMHNAILIAVIVGVTNIIPFFGPYIGGIPSALIVLMDSPFCSLIFIIFMVFLMLFDGNVLGPMLLSESVGLSGFWILFSITAFGGFFGIVGILVGVPVFAIIYDLIRRVVFRMLKKHGMEEYLPVKSKKSI
jgi:predicted PurR-regulated permease PerM